MSKLQRLRPLTQHVPQYARNGAAELCNWIGGAYTNASPLQPACVATAPAGSPTTSNYKVNFAANGELLFTFQETQQLDLEKAVNAAQLAQNEWASRTALQRGDVLRRAAALIDERRAHLAAVEALDTGRCLSETRHVDVPSAIDCLNYCAGVSPTLTGEATMLNGHFTYTMREPLGVCAAIGAWNYPLQSAVFKSAPALACGNAIIVKPSENTPLSALELAEIYHEAGLPEGLYSVLLGGGPTGQSLAEHNQIAKVSFTGSRTTGKKVMAAGVETLKQHTLELGGKSPLIILSDADVVKAVQGAITANFYSNGQVCSNGTRVFVHKSLANDFVNLLLPQIEKITIGNPLDEKTEMGPLVTPQHLDRVLSYVKCGLDEGAHLVYGSQNKLEGDFLQGSYMSPCVFTQCTDEMTIVQEEIFGPVMSILEFETEDEVVARANNTPYGLGAGVYSKDVQRAMQIVAKLKAGCTWINGYNDAPIELPWGGYKESGIGRENGKNSLESWTQIKSTMVYPQ
eukprot:m.262726 g.262726  ORF g.262726 m.262726 type:complete len:515 (-) comp15595_c0_seq10:1668-3212(-)